MAEDIIRIGIALDSSQVLAGTRQTQQALQGLVQAEGQAQAATQKLQQSSTQAAQALGQQGQASSQAATQTASVTQAAQQAAQALQREQDAALRAAEALHKKGQATSSSTTLLQRLSASVGDFGRQVGAFALGQAGILGIQQALSTATQAVTDLVRTGVQMQQLRGSFTAIAGSTAAGTREFQFAVKTANQLGLEVQSVAEQYRSLSAATRGTAMEGAATREMFTTLARAAQAYGLSTEQLGRASIALQQIISKGKVGLEELRGQLSEAIPGAMQIAARAYGVSTSALDEMISKGLDGSEFVRKWIAQLGTEVPPAAERAGKGIAQFGNEILLLKDRIANSGVISFLDQLLSKWGEFLRLSREAGEKEEARAQRRVTRELGTGATPDTITTQQREQLTTKTRELIAAEKTLSDLLKARDTNKFGFATPLMVTDSDLRAARQRVDLLKQEVDAMKPRVTYQSLERQMLEQRNQSMNRGFTEQANQTAAVDSANAKLKTTLEGVKKAIDEVNKSSGLTPEIYGKINGTLQEQIKFYEQRKKATEAGLKDVTETILARGAAGPVPKDLEAKRADLQAQYRADTQALEDAKQAVEALEKAKREAAQQEEERKRKAKQDAEETLRLDAQQAEEVRRTHFQNIEALRRLESQYTSVKGARDEDRASMLAASLATSQYAKEAAELAQRIEAVGKAEAKLPELRAQAERSAQNLAGIDRAMAQFDRPPRRESTEDRLTRQYSQLANQPGVTGLQLTQAAEKMDALLKAESWERWRDAGMDAMADLTQEFAQMAFEGKLSFTSLADHAVQQLFRLASEATMNQLFKKGGWLEQGLGLGLQLLGAFGGAGGSTSGTLPTTWTDYNAMSAAGAFSGRRQGGGPVEAGRPYWVGEAGPELIVPRQSGTVLPHGQGLGAAPIIVNVHGVTDVSSFLQSQGAIQRSIARTVAGAYRAV